MLQKHAQNKTEVSQGPLPSVKLPVYSKSCISMKIVGRKHPSSLQYWDRWNRPPAGEFSMFLWMKLISPEIKSRIYSFFCSCGKYANWIKQAQTLANTLLQDLLFNIHSSNENDSVCVRKEKPKRKVIILCLQLSFLICDSHFSVKEKSILPLSCLGFRKDRALTHCMAVI